jgi:hypothetical protein
VPETGICWQISVKLNSTEPREDPLRDLALLHMDGRSEENSRSYTTFRCETAPKNSVPFAICLQQNTVAWNRLAAQRKEQNQREDVPWETS